LADSPFFRELVQTDQEVVAKYVAFSQEMTHCSVQLPPRERAEAYLRFKADNQDFWWDAEALVYLSSQRIPCDEQINKLIETWKVAEQAVIDQATKPFTVASLDGEPACAGVYGYVPDRFWNSGNLRASSLDAAMLRAVEFCEIGGFDRWWKAISKDFNELVLQGGAFGPEWLEYLFDFARSDLAIDWMAVGLQRCLDSFIYSAGDQEHPGNLLCRDGRFRNSNFAAAAIVFAIHRLKHCAAEDLAKRAAEALLDGRQPDGSWRYWRDDADSSIFATAAAVHALALSRPRGWTRAVRQGAAWLTSQQDTCGSWSDRKAHAVVYLTVLVLDALELAGGGSNPTFRIPASKNEDAGTGRRSTAVAPRSWTQREVDEAVSAYKARRAGLYERLRQGVQSGDPDAHKRVRKEFGRNAIAVALGVRAKAMISKSPAWQVIAEELHIPRKASGVPRRAMTRIGLDKAIEEKAVQDSVKPDEQAASNEILAKIRRLPKSQAEPMAERYLRGGYSDEEVRELLSVVNEQIADERETSRRSRRRRDAQ
jgi:hypothetical protein